MKLRWLNSDQHYPPTMIRFKVGAIIDTGEPGIPDTIPDDVVNDWIAQGFATPYEEPPAAKYRINLELCVECAACLEVCPLGAITADPYAINPDLCNGCGDCAAVCPVEAIEQYEPLGLIASQAKAVKSRKKTKPKEA